MKGKLMPLLVDPNTAPVAHHTPIPVLLHWQEKVKAGLNQDVVLSILEPIAVGNIRHGATTWWSAQRRMENLTAQ